ncbi:uncharacterized protein SPPG_07427 [Spizellomyces punctatus DAOM BR117]|uniref:Sulfotransferase domain-containing protein n=1 Tax=Spizellomyces punctatus (strain DAOM BR117) TaxID=645134 RepID=A0A0L0H715_SPIPD|nr:uncharacterized protein SPPG_07427 [Spizellomyces punctatus DAOM BR117]KNC97027.1 hypothetical protein SPPG_07427 [Spizellomyces punctatus DAOM BR117]|eukprot:XP_016605067.1 hypothetical protein SPPG_07427 [Spizellomyces punctatus DAOM BR117]
MPLEIIGAGFGRTGTKSLQLALQQLGFPCYHMTEAIQHPTDFAVWTDAHDGKQVDLTQIFNKYTATLDWPACDFWKELMEVYPNAKVILSVRDADTWYESVRETVYKLNMLPRSIIQNYPDIVNVNEYCQHSIWGLGGNFKGQFENPAIAKKIFRDRLEEVKRSVPSEKLLVFEVSQGWEPLCKFLERPVPNEPFPRTNERALFQSMIQDIMTGRPIDKRPNFPDLRQNIGEAGKVDGVSEN